MSRGAVQPAIVTQYRTQRSQPQPIRRVSTVQRAVVTLLSKLTATPNPVR